MVDGMFTQHHEEELMLCPPSIKEVDVYTPSNSPSKLLGNHLWAAVVGSAAAGHSLHGGILTKQLLEFNDPLCTNSVVTREINLNEFDLNEFD